MDRKGLILVVDDLPESLVLISQILASAGHDVRLADSGELALASAKAIHPELILLDIVMPGMDGIEVCRRLKAAPETQDIPVVLMSARAEVRQRVEGWNVGAVDFVTKPFEEQELLARVRTRLELSRLKKELEEIVRERTASLLTANERLMEELEERIRADAAVRESEARFRNMADTVSALIWTSGPDGKVNFCNAYALTFTGRLFEELMGDCWKTAVHPEDMDTKHPLCMPAKEAWPHRCQTEFRLRRHDGEYRWMLDTATPRFLADGVFAGYVGIATDITELRRNQEQFLAAQKLESLGVMVAGVAHRFNNLMGTIIAEADLAVSELPEGSAAHDSVGRISVTAVRAAEIVSLLMAYAGNNVGRLTLISVSQTVAETVRLFKATARKEIVFDMNLAGNLPPIHADAARIGQIAMNLLTNAWESLPPRGGSIRVATSLVELADDDAGANGSPVAKGEYVRLEITDNGCGIPKAKCVRIFDPFYTTKALGRGLGLAAVQGIVRGLGGVIRVESTVGTGSTFEVLFPALRE